MSQIRPFHIVLSRARVTNLPLHPELLLASCLESRLKLQKGALIVIASKVVHKVDRSDIRLCRIRPTCDRQRRRLSSPPTADHLAAMAAVSSSSSSSAGPRPRSRGGSGPSSLSGSQSALHRDESETPVFTFLPYQHVKGLSSHLYLELPPPASLHS